MNSEEVDQKFTEWLTYEGDAIASQVHDTLKDTSHSLEIEDGSHAVWHDSHLGMLLVLPFEHAMAFSAEAMTGDFENSPLHNYVFATITELIMRATAVMEESEEDPL
jgi:hypothetical protein